MTTIHQDIYNERQEVNHQGKADDHRHRHHRVAIKQEKKKEKKKHQTLMRIDRNPPVLLLAMGSSDLGLVLSLTGVERVQDGRAEQRSYCTRGRLR